MSWFQLLVSLLTVQAPHQAAPAQVQPKPAQHAASRSTGAWDRLALCESGGNWQANTGNGFYGGVQFTLQSWEAVGGYGYPNNASKDDQIAKATKLQQMQGWQAWPVCSKKVGLR